MHPDQHKVAAARLWAANRYPYLASAVFALSVDAVEGLGGIQVDEWWRVHLDPDVAGRWDINQLGGELLHLTAHVLRDHAGRAKAVELGDTAELAHWVDAADAEIGDDFPVDLPRARPSATATQLGCRDGGLAEEYFRSGDPLASRDGDQQWDCGSGAHGRTGPFDPPPPSSDRGERRAGVGREQQELIRQQVANDVLSADGAPPGLRRWAETRRSPTVDWRAELAAEIRRGVASRRGAVDYSYERPSRRAAAMSEIGGGHGIVALPSLRDPSIDVAVVCDTSSSVDDTLLSTALAEVEGLLRAAGIARVDVLACDDAVQAVSRVRRIEEVQLFGGGGTDMAAGLAVAQDRRPRPSVIVVLTDGFTPWPSVPPERCVVIVGLLGVDPASGLTPPDPPTWSRTVRIEATRSGPNR
ncbi:MAG: VWA-like domain-containing protein [Actinomycetota bacterium]|nr:VWA-like domain-containing protein [Actinomycetota bacterium]